MKIKLKNLKNSTRSIRKNKDGWFGGMMIIFINFVIFLLFFNGLQARRVRSFNGGNKRSWCFLNQNPQNFNLLICHNIKPFTEKYQHFKQHYFLFLLSIDDGKNSSNIYTKIERERENNWKCLSGCFFLSRRAPKRLALSA